MMITNAELFVRVTNIFNAENFDRRLRPVAEFMREHSDQFKILPKITAVKAESIASQVGFEENDLIISINKIVLIFI